MARPCKKRRVCAEPFRVCFVPLEPDRQEGCAERPETAGNGNVDHLEENRIVMTVDEFETIRLIDRDGLTQEECARQMNVARTTVQSIYGSARNKLAVFLTEGHKLCIQGGDYCLCGGSRPECQKQKKCCKKHEKSAQTEIQQK